MRAYFFLSFKNYPSLANDSYNFPLLDTKGQCRNAFRTHHVGSFMDSYDACRNDCSWILFLFISFFLYVSLSLNCPRNGERAVLFHHPSFVNHSPRIVPSSNGIYISYYDLEWSKRYFILHRDIIPFFFLSLEYIKCPFFFA